MEKSKKRNTLNVITIVLASVAVFLCAVMLSFKVAYIRGYQSGMNCTCQTEKECVNKQEIKIDKYGTFNKIQSCRN